MSLVIEADVLILGASFAGVEVAWQLAKRAGGRSIVVVDRLAEHVYIPLIHERLVGRLSARQSTLTTQECLSRCKNLRYLQAEVQAFDPGQREALLANGQRVRGQHVVIALGSQVRPPLALPGREHLLSLKFASDAELLGQRLQAARSHSSSEPVRVVIIGGGISGVETAGEWAREAAQKQAGQRSLHISLVHGEKRLLPGLTARAGDLAQRSLEAQGVDVRLAAQVKSAHKGGIVVDEPIGSEVQETLMPCEVALWAGGIAPAPTLANLGLAQTNTGWLLATPELQASDSQGCVLPQVWVVGDAARVVEQAGEWPTMKRAIEALWQAWVVEKNIRRAFAGQPPLRHRLRRDFPYGVSVGLASLLVFGWIAIDARALGRWFRRFLLRMYLRRYGAHG